MATNQSVKKFQRVLASLPPATRTAIMGEIAHQALVLRNDIRAAAPRGEGALVASVRVEPGRRPMAAVVRAGGPTTTHRVSNGWYDYAIAQEFGTHRNPAQPFFWPTYRAKKKAMRQAIKDEATDAIAALVKLS